VVDGGDLDIVWKDASMELHKDCRWEGSDWVAVVADCTVGKEHVGTGAGIVAVESAAVEALDVTRTRAEPGLAP
jgi:hypothetical protein